MRKKAPNIQYTVKHDLCCGCGICEDVCPSSAISIVPRKGMFIPQIDNQLCNNDKGCHRCHDNCPGLGCNLNELSQKYYANNPIKDRLAGSVLKSYVGHSSDEFIRFHSASGGLITHFLIWLLENKEIDGVIVTRFDKNTDFKVSTFLATSRDDIVSAKSSKYSPVTMAGAIKSIKAAPGERYVVVGLPCHIQGFRKAEEADATLRKKIIGHFSIFCSASRTFYFTEFLMKERKIDLSQVDYLAFRDRGNQGGIVIQGKGIDYYQDYRKYCHPLKSFFVPRRCLLCVDHYGELADLSFGDINIPPYNEDKIGINSLIVRNDFWLTLLKKANSTNAIMLEEVELEEINRSQPSAKMKKERNIAFVQFLRRLGIRVPEYDLPILKHYSFKTIVLYIIDRIQQFMGQNKCFWPFIVIIKKKYK